jgi:hypothetical protein
MDPSVGLILVKPILKGLTCHNKQMVLHIKIFLDTQWIPITYSLGIMGKNDDGLYKNVMPTFTSIIFS